MCADNSARMIVRCDDLARRIAVFDRAFFHVSDQTASAIASLYLSANHRAVFDTFARISLMTDKCADFIPSLNLRIANHDVPNGRAVCIAKQPSRFFISGNFQAGNRVALSVKHTRKRQHVVRRIKPANRRPVGIARQIDIVHQQHRFAAHVVAAVDVRCQLSQIRRGIDINLVLAGHPHGQIA